MDDARLADGMTLTGIAKRLDSIQADLGVVKSGLGAVGSELAAVRTEMNDGLTAVRAEMATGLTAVRAEMATGFTASKIREEELRSLAKLGLEANQGLLETTAARFNATDRKHDEEISVLRDVLRQSASRGARSRTQDR